MEKTQATADCIYLNIGQGSARKLPGATNWPIKTKLPIILISSLQTVMTPKKLKMGVS